MDYLRHVRGLRRSVDEQVTAHKVLLRKLALVARPAFRLNHALMMRHGLRGLNAYLAGMRLGLADPES